MVNDSVATCNDISSMETLLVGAEQHRLVPCAAEASCTLWGQSLLTRNL